MKMVQIRTRVQKTSFNDLVDWVSRRFTFISDADSKTTKANANTPTELRNKGGKEIIDLF